MLIFKTMEKKEIIIDGMRYGEHELAQLIRRKMLVRSIKNMKKYNRKVKHKKALTCTE